MLTLTRVNVSASGTPIVHDVDLTVGAGELHVLMGPNGSGKSSLLGAIMGLPSYAVTAGDIVFDGQSVLGLSASARARLGIGLAFQRPPAVEGVTVGEFARALGAAEELAREAEALDLADFRDRGLGVGFSGGETKRWEVLKLVLQKPQLLLFDEPESGVDLEHVAAVGAAINRLMAAPGSNGLPRAGLVITHTGLILDHVRADRSHIVVDGRIIHSGEPRALLRQVQSGGYAALDAA